MFFLVDEGMCLCFMELIQLEVKSIAQASAMKIELSIGRASVFIILSLGVNKSPQVFRTLPVF